MSPQRALDYMMQQHPGLILPRPVSFIKRTQIYKILLGNIEMQIKNSGSEAIEFNFCRRLESAKISSKVKHFAANFLKITPELIFL